MQSDFDVLQELNSGFIRAVRDSDAAWFERNLSDDFLNSNADGTIVGRAAFLQQIAQPMRVANFRLEDVQIRILGDTAIAHGRTAYSKPGGEPGNGRYMDVYIREDGRWVCVSADVTRA